MRRFSRCLRLVAALAALAGPALAGPALAGSPGRLDAPGQTPFADSGVALQLEVVRNGQDVGLIAAFTQRLDGGFDIAPSELTAIGLVAPNSRGAVRLETLSGVTYRYDDLHQIMFIQARPSALTPTVISFRAHHETAPLSHDTGVLLNYSLSVNADNAGAGHRLAFSDLDGAFDMRAFGPFGLVASGFDVGVDGAGQGHFIRLDTTWTYSALNSLITAHAGDFISSGFSWTRPIHMAGFEIGRDFALRPDMITVPTPTLSATAAAPSTLDVLLGSSTILSREVPEGPVQISDLPVLQGQGQARLVLRDALGGEQQVIASYFATPDLLAPGMLDFSAEAGFARRNFGLLSNDYLSDPLAAGSVRYGVSNSLTLQAHTEDGDGLTNFGGGLATRVGNLGVASFAAAYSDYGSRSGALFAVSFETRLSVATVSAQVQQTTGDYRDLAAVTVSQQWSWQGLQLGEAPRTLVQVSLSAPLAFAVFAHNGNMPSIGVSYSEIQNRTGPARSVLNASMQYRVSPRVSLQASVYASHADTAETGFFVALSFSLGRGHDASAGVEEESGQTKPFIEVSQEDQPEVGSAAWRVRVEGGAQPDVQADASYRSDIGRLTGYLAYGDGGAQLQGRIDGAVVWLGQTLVAPDRIDGAFAAIDVGAPHVAVTEQGRAIGFSNAKGWILASNLQPYEANRLDIDVEALSLDFTTRQTHQVVSPPAGAGVLVRFGVGAAQVQARVTLKREDGGYIPAGALASLNGGKSEIVVGYDGEVFLTELSALNLIRVDLGDEGFCVAHLSVDLSSKAHFHVAQLVCRSTTPRPVVVARAAAAVPVPAGQTGPGPRRVYRVGGRHELSLARRSVQHRRDHHRDLVLQLHRNDPGGAHNALS